ncbi:hypothetical protein AAEU42_10080 [Pseudoflavonifractor phocaeensis]|uniref:hypothetical protein n=1 Tax=Pseudoflavonifractor phocaeensis TaxID=1870988 RepID=UPI00313DBE24
MLEESKYKSQMKNLRKNYVRFPLDLKPEVLDGFKAACSANGTTPTTEIKKFIARYCAKYGRGVPGLTTDVEVELPANLARFATEQGIDLNDFLVDLLTEKLGSDGEKT